MTINLTLLKETDKARLYGFKDGCELWIPRSVITRCVKHKNDDVLKPEVHELEIEDWWWDKYYNVDEKEFLDNENY